ncbi:hypothetical protein M422DRAFT_31327 [Sphaerobolus stellatus SS14]|uniref:Protein kinase domain-containing protein n=1 Tax=Sphaerobolus stellatus (strain SS14) TaxID=990650 RepID=A0A0C9VVN0_SPHS4|nr:hypothetical protein M422DRAFT_31327 [Sphaerobolus stellatus SS14]
MAADVEKSVQDELYKTLFTVDTRKFLEKIIPIASKDVRKIFAGLKKAKLYDSQNACWTNFPTEGSNEIMRLVESNGLAEDGAMAGRWVDCHHKPPESTDVRAAAIRPDGAFISNEIDPAKLKKHNDRLEELEKALGGKRRTRSATKPPELEKDEQEENKLCRLWWLHMANVIEFKAKSGPDDVRKALLQLCGYARQILREQLDRRFVIAFTICFDKLNLYLFDRSGIVATNQSINIHTEPEKFIQAVACFSVLPTERLGWDPTIAMFHREHRAYYPSYKFPWKELEAFSSPYMIQWVVQNPENPSEKFVSIRSLSLIGAEMMCGRATIVLEVVTYEEYMAGNADQAQVFVMKQSWQRLPGKHNDNTGQVIALENSSPQYDLLADLPSDGDSQDKPFDKIPYEVYAHSEANLKDRIHCSGYVKSHGEIVDTLLTIRKGLTGNPGTLDSNIPSKRSIDLIDRERFIYEQTIETTGEKQILFAPRHPRLASRRQTRIFMRMRGYPLKYFRNLKELLTVIHDAVRDHQRFFLKGILHRDISGGNILILIPTDGHFRQSGFLLDLDHSKITKKFLPWKRTERLETAKFNAVKAYETADDRTVHLATAVFGADRGEVSGYINAVAKSRGLEGTQQPISPEQLGWDDNTEDHCPWFSDHIPGSGLRTGTYPYMSHQIISGKAAHDAIHDIESFWWILIHLALTREGPGKRREERSAELDIVIEEYFDGSVSQLTKAKTGIFDQYRGDQTTQIGLLEDQLLKNFHPFFEPVKDLIREWRELLRLGFAFKGHEYHDIHKRTLDLLQATIEKIPDETGELSQQEDARRVKYHTSTKDTIMTQQCVDSLPLTPKPNEKHNPRDSLSIEPGSPTPSGPNVPKRLRIEGHRH